jgi:hypothetical protein
MYGPVVLPREQQGFLATATQHAPIPVMCDELVGVLVMTELIDGLLIVHRDVRVLHRPGRRVVPVHLFHTGLPLPLVDGHRGIVRVGFETREVIVSRAARVLVRLVTALFIHRAA